MDQNQPVGYEAFSGYLAISWADGHESLLPADVLRDGCPCAQCCGEPDLLGRIERPTGFRKPAESGYRLVSLQPVGRYGLQLVWGDGHSTGIYTFEYLRGLCDCDQCCTLHEPKICSCEQRK